MNRVMRYIIDLKIRGVEESGDEQIVTYLTYKDADNATTLKTVTCLDGVPQESAPSAPSKTATDQYSFSFVGWNTVANQESAESGCTENILVDTTVYPAFSKSVRSYTVTWKNSDNTTLKTDTVEYGTTPSYGESTPQNPNASGGAFSGWSPAISSVTGDAVYTATFADITAYLTYKDTDNATTLKTVAYINGVAQDTAPSNPTKTATAQYQYTFVGWNTTASQETAESGCTENVTTDRTVYPAFSKVVMTYTVIWKDADNSTLETDTNVAYGTTPTYDGATPSYGGGTFDAWSPAVSAVTGDATYTATYTSGEEPSGEPITGEISDSWDTIITKIGNGTANYAVGAYKSVNLGTEGTINMQIVALNADELSSGSGNAATTWISKELLTTAHRMNPTRAGSSGNYTEGTGGIGGWDKSEMKSYILETIVPKLPQVIRNNVKTVKKYSRTYNSAGSAVINVQTNETFWLPSKREVNLSGNPETEGPSYSAVFPDDASRVKINVASLEDRSWWLRSSFNSKSFNTVTISGASYNGDASQSYGVALGFCI